MQPDVRGQIAAEVRAEMARQRRASRDLAALLGIDQGSASLRLQGERSFRAEELARVAEWLGVPVSQFIPESESVA